MTGGKTTRSLCIMIMIAMVCPGNNSSQQKQYPKKFELTKTKRIFFAKDESVLVI